MERRKFIKQTGLTAFAVSVFGKVSMGETCFIGNSTTTTDVLGPFYRPGAPIRTNINPTGYTGSFFHVSGTIFKEDGITPFENCKIEVWQCDQNEKYDNLSDEYKYRGAQVTGKDGKYHFITTHPVPYPATDDPNRWRAPHIHMLVTGEGQQDLITQIFFKGSKYIDTDGPATAKDAVNRILTIKQNQKGEESVSFDIRMAKEFKLSDNAIKKIKGTYKMSDKSLVELYFKGDLLFIKQNGHIKEGLFYKGDNVFVGGSGQQSSVKFELLQENVTKIYLTYHRPTYNDKLELEGIRTLNY